MTTYYPAEITPHGQYLLDEGVEPSLTYTSYDETLTFYLRGGKAPTPGVQDGVVLQQISGISPPFRHLTSQGARQDGATWNDTLYDPMEIDMVLEATALTSSGMSQVMSDWVAAWDPRKPGRLEWETADSGTWWADVRLFKAWPDQITQSSQRRRRHTFTHAAVAMDAFWKTTDSVASGGSYTVTNIGDQDAWPSYLCYGPGTFTFEGGVTFGPLLSGQIVLITTNPRLRSVVDLTPGQVGDPTTGLQDFLDLLIRLVTFDQVPPLLVWFESLFGIRPPQGVLYSLLSGRFTTPVPGVANPADAVPYNLSVSGGTVIASITPQRRWPEYGSGSGS